MVPISFVANGLCPREVVLSSFLYDNCMYVCRFGTPVPPMVGNKSAGRFPFAGFDHYNPNIIYINPSESYTKHKNYMLNYTKYKNWYSTCILEYCHPYLLY